MAETLTREEFKTLVNEVIAPFIIEIKSLYTSNEKEIERLTKQSTEHYANNKSMEDKLQGQMMQCQNNMSDSAERNGSRVGDIERDIAKIETRVEGIEKNMADDSNDSKWNKEMLIVIAVAVIPTVLWIVDKVIG